MKTFRFFLHDECPHVKGDAVTFQTVTPANRCYWHVTKDGAVVAAFSLDACSGWIDITDKSE